MPPLHYMRVGWLHKDRVSVFVHMYMPSAWYKALKNFLLTEIIPKCIWVYLEKEIWGEVSD